MPSSTTEAGFSAMMSRPSKVILPDGVVTSREMALTSVDLPAPFAPTTETMVPGSIRTDT